MAARRLTSRKGRHEAGLFLAEGAQAVREALRAKAAIDVFATAEALARHAQLLAEVAVGEVAVGEINLKDAQALSETVTPQGLVAVCRVEQPSLAEVLSRSPRLLVVLVEPNDPGNLGTIIRTADAAGADAVIVDGGVDPYNGKVVRSSVGALFHLPVVSCPAGDLLAGAAQLGIAALAATGRARETVDDLAADGTLARPTAWLFGNEAHGLPTSVLAAADREVRVPIYGRAESLNLAVAAGICLYASARAQRSAAD